jgi:hypothetical protein
VNLLTTFSLAADVLLLCVETWTSGHVEAAIKSYEQALALRTDFPEATCNLLHTLQCVCDWDDRDKKFSEVEAVVRRQIQMQVLPSVQPFHAIAYPIDAMLALEIRYISSEFERVVIHSATCSFVLSYI